MTIRMTIDEIKKRIAHIESISADDERAHAEEDSLHEDVLEAIATGNCELPMQAAALALTTKDILFSRWCA